MKTGISTASLFTRFNTEDALSFLDKNGVKTSEIFFESFCEYKEEFGKILKERRKNIEVHSVHSMTTQFEPQLFSVNDRASGDSFFWLNEMMKSASLIGAKYYTFHGQPRYLRKNVSFDIERIASTVQKIIDAIKPHGIKLAYENVHWCHYNYIGFFTEMKKRTEGLKGTLDIKQARLSEIPYYKYIDEMKGDIVTVHISDVDINGRMCLPGKGTTDFYDLFSRLKDVGFDGAILLEAYQNDYKEFGELFSSLNYVEELADKVFSK